MAINNIDIQDEKENSYRPMANPDSISEFTKAATRTNIASGDTHRTIFGKICKFFADLGTSAFSGLANNLTTTAAGYGMDARQGPVIQQKFDQINSNFEELNQNLGALNDSGAIKGMDAREDGVYITYTPVAGADTVTKKLGSGISFRWKYAGQPNVVSGTIQQISEIDVSNYTFATFAVHTNSANLDINILGNGTAISSFKTGTQKLNVNEYTSISANFAVKYNLPATIDITITLD